MPVLWAPVLNALAIAPSGAYLDGTFGRGGHARGILDRLGPQGRLLVMDKDPEAIREATSLAASDARVRVRQASFATLGEWSETAGGLDGVLFDLGVSSPQLDDARRGFSFRHDGPLDMRMDPTQGLSAADFVNHADEAEIARVLWLHGEERQSRRIAKAIVLRRGEKPFERTGDLADVIAKLLGRGDGRTHPATRSFQAIRIHVNAELDDLQAGLEAALCALKPGGRLAVISFHSLEDRITKQFINERAKAPPANRRDVVELAFTPRLRDLSGAIKADATELAANPRARSAVLRVAEKLATAELGA
ncbi:16S rRNA (cytosine(1402)-N(4))-methyltransferase RsmH [Silanimonas sp.]|uniref:16S rRNA (cytosine(1402)-N(4))-methyltransferase RsmH n=1 Tax=Silanimonas sp. TaxID=1929290 RepID=UPI001BC0E69E|nr:16S rRNA (cytosine(1402)-N(4))-methyltransferase RsmH [Silanimonas sp.]MBS3896154.1 16S rRNA (cytosine(1402)-N(4))-methyltransferase RsmH [Silanimonas sp.]